MVETLFTGMWLDESCSNEKRLQDEIEAQECGLKEDAEELKLGAQQLCVSYVDSSSQVP